MVEDPTKKFEHVVIDEASGSRALRPELQLVRELSVPNFSGVNVGVLRDERAEAEATFGESQVFELSVRAVHGVGVDRHLRHDVAHRWQLVTIAQSPHRDGVADLVDQLSIRRDAASRVQAEDDAGLPLGHVLVH